MGFNNTIQAIKRVFAPFDLTPNILHIFDWSTTSQPREELAHSRHTELNDPDQAAALGVGVLSGHLQKTERKPPFGRAVQTPIEAPSSRMMGRSRRARNKTSSERDASHHAEIALLRSSHQNELRAVEDACNDRMAQADLEDRELRAQIHRETARLREKLSRRDDTISGLMQSQKSLENREAGLQSSLRQMANSLADKDATIARLEGIVAEQESIVTKAHSNAINLLAQHISTEFPDDVVRRELDNFFDQDFLGWCMDYKVDRITDSSVVHMLKKRGIMAGPVGIPPRLQLDLGGPTAAAVLLEAALSNDLLESFLSNPFFLQGDIFYGDHLASVANNSEAFLTWRGQTCEFLEAVFPPTNDDFVQLANRFASKHAALVRALGSVAMEELVQLFRGFAKLAMRLWKCNTRIVVERLGNPSLERYQAGGGNMRLHATQLQAGTNKLEAVVGKARAIFQGGVVEGCGLGSNNIERVEIFFQNELEAEAREEHWRVKSEFNEQLQEVRPEQLERDRQRAKFEEQLQQDREEGKRLLELTISQSNKLVNDLMKQLEKVRAEEEQTALKETIRDVEIQERNTAATIEGWMKDMESITREIHANREAQYKTQGQEWQERHNRIKEFENEKNQKTTIFWSSMGAWQDLVAFFLH
ncbi:hypothetical protein B0I35DRAFT_509533 [Stachybotrys elegans]|uniref:Uncharacterized protein n=1 Tax=Stachybotrys elegans TaxID=80388 RepID=A0A8K0WVA3_9HYPO|nr:hypothetical protein B0I35DRAFT_509533 [Stachybotrys elegans]